MENLSRDNTPGCYMNATSQLAAEQISLSEFFNRCLAHFGPVERRTHHLPDQLRLDQFIHPLIRVGKHYGLMAAAIKLCEGDPLLASSPGETLAPFLSACSSGSLDMASIRSCNPSMNEADVDRILASPLFRQTMLFTAIAADNPVLAIKIVEYEPLATPPPDKWLLGNRYNVVLGYDSDQAKFVRAAIVRNGWAEIFFSSLIEAICGGDSAGSIYLLDAINETRPNLLAAYPIHKDILLDNAIKLSTPKYYNIYGSYTMCPRLSGGVKMLEWLLDRGLNVNYRRLPESDEEVPDCGDPRETAERLDAFQQAPISHEKTALHAAAFAGNAEAVKYLLLRGASVDAQDGLGQTARYIAERDGHEAVVRVIDTFVQDGA